jgi:hypothetical protein
MDSYIDNYIGEWRDEMGNRLVIQKSDDNVATVSFFSAHNNKPILRPWAEGKPSVDMAAKYIPEEGPDLVVELWKEGKGFCLHLNFEPGYILDQSRRDAIIPALSRYEEDKFVDQYYSQFHPIRHYTRTEPEHAHAH